MKGLPLFHVLKDGKQAQGYRVRKDGRGETDDTKTESPFMFPGPDLLSATFSFASRPFVPWEGPCTHECAF